MNACGGNAASVDEAFGHGRGVSVFQSMERFSGLSLFGEKWFRGSYSKEDLLLLRIVGQSGVTGIHACGSWKWRCMARRTREMLGDIARGFAMR